ncbi:MAG: glycosyltransferase family 39 protein [Elusimicrobiota bacterium]|nr:MAG: glycosyltransferase family 39 protein [Elusimicrobiota bacterium]
MTGGLEDRRVRLGALAALTAAAFALRARGAGADVVDLHELFQMHAIAGAGSFAAFVAQLRDKPLHVLLDPLLTFAASRVSSELWWLRLQPALLGAACVPALYAFARRSGAATALTACALLAASLHHVEFSAFVDFYPILVLWTLVSSERLAAAAESGRPRDFAWYAAALTGFLYTHPWSVLVAGFHAAWVAARRRDRLVPFLAAAGAAGVLFLPFFAWSLSRVVRDPAFAYSGAGHARPFYEAWWTLRCWAGEPERGLYDPGAYEAWTRAGGVLYAALAALGAWRLTVERRWDDRWRLAAALALGGVPAVFAVDWFFAYDYMPRQAIFVLPFFLLFAAEGLAWRPARKAGAAAAALLFAFLFFHYSRQLSKMRNRFVQAAAQAEAGTRPGDTLLFDEPNFAAWFLYYYDRPAFFRLGPPRLVDGFYVFVLPDGFTAGGGAGSRPCGTPTRLPRWRSAAGRTSGRAWRPAPCATRTSASASCVPWPAARRRCSSLPWESACKGWNRSHGPKLGFRCLD